MRVSIWLGVLIGLLALGGLVRLASLDAAGRAYLPYVSMTALLSCVVFLLLSLGASSRR